MSRCQDNDEDLDRACMKNSCNIHASVNVLLSCIHMNTILSQQCPKHLSAGSQMAKHIVQFFFVVWFSVFQN